MSTRLMNVMPPLHGPSVQMLEDALAKSPTKAILLEINSAVYQLSREGQWFKFSRLTKKRTIKKAAIFETITELYNQLVHGNTWKITGYAGI